MNLIICSTPFQVLVAEKIIKKYPEKTFFAMMIVMNDNEKYRYYARRLLDKCSGNGEIYTLKKQKSKFGAVIDLLFLKLKGLNLKNIDDIYLASFDSILIQTFISGIKFNKLYTFDDGTANIVNDSYYYSVDRHKNFTFKLAKFLLKNPYDLNILKNQSIQHYTVYQLKNVMDNTVYLSLYDNLENSCIDKNQQKETISFLLGQPIYELDKSLTKQQSDEQNIQIARDIIKKFKIDYYFPHPRENYRIDGVEYIQTKLVAEDYFLQKLSPAYQYKIYTFCSGAVFPFFGMDFVEVICIQPHDCPESLISSYELMKNAGANILAISID